MRDVHRGMSGEIISGIDDVGKKRTFDERPSFPSLPQSRPLATAPAAPAAPPPVTPKATSTPPPVAPIAGPIGPASGVANVAAQTAASALSAAFPSKPPQTSAMQTGNPRVGFQGVEERNAQMQATNEARLAGVRSGMQTATEARTAQADGPYRMPRPDGSFGGVILKNPGQGTLLSEYGTGSSTFPRPGGDRPTTRIADETGDRTREFTPGGQSSSTEFPPAPAAGRSGSSTTANSMRRQTQPQRGDLAPPDLASVPQVPPPPPEGGPVASRPSMPEARSGEWVGPPTPSPRDRANQQAARDQAQEQQRAKAQAEDDQRRQNAQRDSGAEAFYGKGFPQKPVASY